MTAIKHIPLSNLVPSAVNVRRTDRLQRVDELAASIKAHGLLQNLTVRRVSKGRKHAGAFEVIAGGRRLAALKALAKSKALSANFNVPCHVIEDGIAAEISLAENTMQCPMHPADQYDAFRDLHEKHGMAVEDVAANFGVTPLVVRQRLKLAAVSPKLMKAYRQGDMSLEQLMAFTITDDHARQEEVWEGMHSACDRADIQEALAGEQVPTTDRRAIFVGAQAYEAAGGVITRDLFNEAGGYFTDPALLNRLVTEKLEATVATIKAEGWKWVSAADEHPYDEAHRMERVYPRAAKLTKAAKKRLRKLEKEREALEDQDYDETTEAAIEKLNKQIEAIARPAYTAKDIAIAGVFISLDHRSGLRIERGYVRREDRPKAKAKAKNGEASTDEKDAPTLSAPLVAELTAYRTVGLRNALALAPETALTAVLHALVQNAFFFGPNSSLLQLRLSSAPLESHAEGIASCEAVRAMVTRHDQWAARLPEDSASLWHFLEGLTADERLQLLAHCASLSLDAVQLPKQNREPDPAHVAQLSEAVRLDMTQVWQPTATGYFMRVGKDTILEAVREAAGEDAVRRIAGLKKRAMAEEAEKLVAGKGWLPPLLRSAAA